jgi:uncharacterized membrane protein
MSDQKNSMGMDEKTASWFAYILSIVSGIILLVTEKDNKNVRTHAWQSIVMGGFFIAVYIVLAILSAIFFNPWNPGSWGAIGFFAVLNWIISLGWLALTVICIIKALQGDIFKVPVIYNKVKDLK